MIFNPASVLTFIYEKDSHLTAYLLVKNPTKAPIGFKFKVSTPNKFVISPNTGMIKPLGQIRAKIVLHRDIVDNAHIERVHFVYGDHLGQVQPFKVTVEGNNKNEELNLTVIVQKKQEQVKILKKQLQKYKKTSQAPSSSTPKSGGTSKMVLIVVAVIALAVGYLLPFRVME